jgi:hypothetical protein
MESQCLLCDQPTGIGGIGSTVRTGNAANPDIAVLCPHCAALRSEERRQLRDRAMVRMLRNGSDPSGSHPAAWCSPSAMLRARSRTPSM